MLRRIEQQTKIKERNNKFAFIGFAMEMLYEEVLYLASCKGNGRTKQKS